MRSRQHLRSLPRPLGLGAHEDRLPQPTESATPTLLRPQHHQVTSFKFHFQLGAPPRAALFPCRVGPSLRHVSLLFYVVSLPCWGRPSGCIIPKSLGPDPAACTPLAFIFGPCVRPIMLVIWCLFLLGVRILGVKGGVPEHRDSGLLPALQPSPSGFAHGITPRQTSDG